MKMNHQNNKEFSRLLTAAVINGSFCQTLLTNPQKAVSSGFGGEVFNFSADVMKNLSSIHATSLADFASQLTSL